MRLAFLLRAPDNKLTGGSGMGGRFHVDVEPGNIPRVGDYVSLCLSPDIQGRVTQVCWRMVDHRYHDDVMVRLDGLSEADIAHLESNGLESS